MPTVNYDNISYTPKYENMLALFNFYLSLFLQQAFVISPLSGVSMCDDAESQAFLDTSQLKARRINETIAVLEGPFEHKTEMDGTIKVITIIYLLSYYLT